MIETDRLIAPAAEPKEEAQDRDKGQTKEEVKKECRHRITVIFCVVDPVNGPYDGAPKSQGHTKGIGKMKSEGVAMGRDHQDPGITHKQGNKILKPDFLFEQRNGQDCQGDGPGIVEGLCFLGRKQIIGLEQDQVIEKGVEQSENQGSQILPSSAGKQESCFALQGENESQY